MLNLFAFSLSSDSLKAIIIVGYLSGGNINRAVTSDMALADRIIILTHIVMYIVAKCMVLAGHTCVLQQLLDETYQNDLGHTSEVEKISELKSMGIEFILRMLLSCDPDKPDNRFISPF